MGINLPRFSISQTYLRLIVDISTSRARTCDQLSELPLLVSLPPEDGGGLCALFFI